MLPFLALFALTVSWFLLPLMPAFRELLRPTDIAPLKVVDRSSGYVAYFARNFRQYLARQLVNLAAEARTGDFLGTLPDGTPYFHVHSNLEALRRIEPAPPEQRLIQVDREVTLEAGGTYLMEVNARERMVGGSGSAYRAIYAEKELVLGEATRVFRWAHAGGPMIVGAGSVLRGRITSDTSVSLGRDVIFERIGAPVIAVGEVHDPPPDPPALAPAFKLPDQARRIGNHVRIEGDLDVPEGTRITSSLVVAGRLRLGVGSIVEGSVKAHREVELADEAQVLGAVVTRTGLVMGQASWIGGPAIAEVGIRLGKNAVVGGPNLPATLSAPEVTLASGATVYGQISAMRGARTD